jgi:hypothetical protein
MLDRLADAREAGLHVAGYLSYEAGLALEDRLGPIARRRDPAAGTGQPLAWFGLFEGVRLIAPGDLPAMLPDPHGAQVGALRPLIGEAGYHDAFSAVQDYIRAGDIYQVNLTFPCDIDLAGDPMALYAAVRPRAAAGYGGVIRDGGRTILSFSPELFFTQVRGQLTARPMKGTAPRARPTEDDAAIARWLQSDAKQRAENLMIVDLLRNDLSRVSQAGSVTVPDLFKVETYPTVHQLVSTVRARILPGLSPVDVLRVLFPCGSITGAPKVRAMEIIDAVEPHAASTPARWAGSILKATPPSMLPFAPFASKKGQEPGGWAWVPASSRIRRSRPNGRSAWPRAASSPGPTFRPQEREEFSMALADGRFDLLETMAFDPHEGLRLLDLHLARMKASADALGFSFDRHAVRNELQAATFRLRVASRVRLLVSRGGAVAIEVRDHRTWPQAIVPVAVVPRNAPAHDPRLLHKTTDRSLYRDALKRGGTYEVLLKDDDGFLTEG